jgi:hypothetical protein
MKISLTFKGYLAGFGLYCNSMKDSNKVIKESDQVRKELSEDIKQVFAIGLLAGKNGMAETMADVNKSPDKFKGGIWLLTDIGFMDSKSKGKVKKK